MNEINEQSVPSLIEVYADGSGNTFDSDGGFGWCVVVDGELANKGSGYIASATNNVAEITAAIEGLKEVGKMLSAIKSIQMTKVVLISDSQLTLNWANGKYRCKAEHLKPLVKELRQLYSTLANDVRWVKGHAGDEFNEICDQLAGAARKGKGL